MKRILFHILLACLPLVVHAEAPRPNIVLILCDDMGWSDIGCYGGEIRTPNLDRLAEGGMRFTQFYNCAKCTTTRAALLTGVHPRRGDRPLLGEDMITLGEALKAAGYRTSLSGKWHLGSQAPRRPIDRGFEEYYGLMDGCCNFFNPAKQDPPFKNSRYRVFGHNERRITEFPEDYYTTDAFSDHAVSMIDRYARGDAPFFVHVAYTAPHYPLHAKEEDIARYERRYLDGWTELREERHKKQIEMGLIDPGWKLPGPDPEVVHWDEVQHKKWQARRMAVYAAMVDSMDQGIGRILAALERNNVSSNTLVLFLSDNGGCSEEYAQDVPSVTPGAADTYTTCGPGWAYAQNTPFRRFKVWMHEGGIATPMIAYWPGRISAGQITGQVGHIIDFLPTFIELAGTTLPETRNGKSLIPVEGKSLVPVFEGRQRQGHEILAWEFYGNRAIRRSDWKLCWDKKVKQWELYNMSTDRTESNDLASQYPERVEQLKKEWFQWALKTGVVDQTGEKTTRF